MSPWKTFLLWLLISIAVSVLLMMIFHTVIVLGVLLIPLGVLYSRSRAREKHVPPTERDQRIEPK